MAEFTIDDKDLTGLKGKVVVLTGGSSGIGLATVNLLLSLGASVVSGDVQAPPEPAKPNFTFVQTNVTKWADLTALFKKAKETYGRVDAVFVNAGVAPKADWTTIETDEAGELKEPDHIVMEINLKAVINTSSLGLHYLKQNTEGGSLVIMASSTGLHPVRGVDYSTAKHGVIGLGRGLARCVELAKLPIRVNVLAPSWTASQILPDIGSMISAVNHSSQGTDVPAKAVAFLMVDGKRHGDIIFICDGKFIEIEKPILQPAYLKVKGDGPSDDEILGRLMALAAGAQ